MYRTDPICFATGDLRKQDCKQQCLSLENECSRYAQRLHSFSAIRIRTSELVDVRKEGLGSFKRSLARLRVSHYNLRSVTSVQGAKAKLKVRGCRRQTFWRTLYAKLGWLIRDFIYVFLNTLTEWEQMYDITPSMLLQSHPSWSNSGGHRRV